MQNSIHFLRRGMQSCAHCRPVHGAPDHQGLLLRPHVLWRNVLWRDKPKTSLASSRWRQIRSSGPGQVKKPVKLPAFNTVIGACRAWLNGRVSSKDQDPKKAGLKQYLGENTQIQVLAAAQDGKRRANLGAQCGPLGQETAVIVRC